MIATTGRKNIPVGLELYSVRDELKKNDAATVRRVAQMGYQDVEFFAPYYNWTAEHAKEMRKLLDDLGIRCLSTHNSMSNFEPSNLSKAIDLNKTLGAKYVVMASSGKYTTLDEWKKVPELLTSAMDQLRPAGLRSGYHNHFVEFKPIDGKRPIEVIAENTPKDVMLQLDVGTCVEAGSDPVAWIDSHPGRIHSMHCKDWDPVKGYRVLLGEGAVPWKKLLQAAEQTGGIEFYLIEQEGYDLPEFETAEKCLANFKKLRSS